MLNRSGLRVDPLEKPAFNWSGFFSNRGRGRGRGRKSDRDGHVGHVTPKSPVPWKFFSFFLSLSHFLFDPLQTRPHLFTFTPSYLFPLRRRVSTRSSQENCLYCYIPFRLCCSIVGNAKIIAAGKMNFEPIRYQRHFSSSLAGKSFFFFNRELGAF